MDNSIRKEELREYIELLAKLQDRDIRCEDKIERALKELHNLIFPQAIIKSTDIYINGGVVGKTICNTDVSYDSALKKTE